MSVSIDNGALEDFKKELKSPEKLHLIKDADSTQTEAILKVVNGQNLVIQGPPQGQVASQPYDYLIIVVI